MGPNTQSTSVSGEVDWTSNLNPQSERNSRYTAIFKVIIVGASFAGRMCAQHLLAEAKAAGQDIEVVIIDKSSHFEFICTNYKSLCDDDSFDYLTVSNETAMGCLNGTPSEPEQDQQDETTQTTQNQEKPISFYHGKLKQIYPTTNSIVVEKIEGSNQINENVEMLYDVLVVCTGATYPSPWRDEVH